MTWGSTGGGARVPFMHDTRIESEAEALLNEWASQGHGRTVPVPIDEIIELHLGLTFEVSDLRASLKLEDVLGAIWFHERTIRVDASLDPHVNPMRLGRYNFTLAHEAGHWVLHRRHLQESAEQRHLFEEGAGPAFVCRARMSAPEEIQANKFAAYLLMPRAELRAAWDAFCGDNEIAISDLVSRSGGLDAEPAIQEFCRPLAGQFKVSAQAMGIRLQDAGFIVSQAQPSLFTKGS